MDLSLTTKAQEALSAAVRDAAAAGHAQVEPAHLLKALAQQTDTTTGPLLDATGSSAASALQAAAHQAASAPPPQPEADSPSAGGGEGSSGEGDKPPSAKSGRRGGRSATMTNDEWARIRKDNHVRLFNYHCIPLVYVREVPFGPLLSFASHLNSLQSFHHSLCPLYST